MDEEKLSIILEHIACATMTAGDRRRCRCRYPCVAFVRVNVCQRSKSTQTGQESKGPPGIMTFWQGLIEYQERAWKADQQPGCEAA